MRVLAVDHSVADLLVLRSLLDRSAEPAIVVVDTDLDDAILRFSEAAPVDVVLAGTKVADRADARRLRQLAVVIGARPLIYAGDDIDGARLAELARLGVDSILPKSAWTRELLEQALVLAASASSQPRADRVDSLTGLPDRSIWVDRLSHALSRARRSGMSTAALALDGDDFKRVNDTFGHEAGDAFLSQVSRRLRSAVREQDTVARLGGDEFGILLEDLPYPEAAMVVAEKILVAVSEPIWIQGSPVPVSLSVGVAVTSSEGRTATVEWMQRSADVALYEAKGKGKGCAVLYSDDIDSSLLEAIRLDTQVLSAVSLDQFGLAFQPVVDLRTGSLDGFEALMRWQGGQRQGTPPSVFIPALERLGLVGDVGRAVTVGALRTLSRWRAMTGADLSMRINVSAMQLRSESLADLVARLVVELDIPPASVTFELTESTLLERTEEIERELARLREIGVRLSIDDFGTGFNSLVQLRQVRPDELKVDRSFVMEIANSSVDLAIIRSQAVLAHGLAATIVAEGVETEEQALALLSIDEIQYAQGFHFGVPMSPLRIEKSYRPFRRLVDGQRGSGDDPSGRAGITDAGRLHTASA